MLTKGAIGNLINRYKAVLKKCHLINVFGSLAVAAMLTASLPAGAAAMDQDLYEATKAITTFGNEASFPENTGDTKRIYFGGGLAEAGQTVEMDSSLVTLSSGTLTGEMNAGGLAYGAGAVSNVTDANISMSGGTLTQMTDHPTTTSTLRSAAAVRPSTGARPSSTMPSSTSRAANSPRQAATPTSWAAVRPTAKAPR